MSLAVARMITTMVAAYFLKSKGQQTHGDGSRRQAEEKDQRGLEQARERLQHLLDTTAFELGGMSHQCRQPSTFLACPETSRRRRGNGVGIQKGCRN